MNTKEEKKIKPWEDAGKSEDYVNLADMHGDGVHFDKEIMAKAQHRKVDNQTKSEKKPKNK